MPVGVNDASLRAFDAGSPVRRVGHGLGDVPMMTDYDLDIAFAQRAINGEAGPDEPVLPPSGRILRNSQLLSLIGLNDADKGADADKARIAQTDLYVRFVGCDHDC